MLLHYTIVLFLLCKIYLTGAVNSVSKFEYCSNGNTNLHRILKEVSSVGSRIQCAAVCQNHPDCKGYGYAQNKTCYLLGTGNGHCTEKDCTSWHNIKIYTVISNELNPNYCTKSTTSTHSMYSREMNSATSPLAPETNSAAIDSSAATESTAVASTETSLSTTTEEKTGTEEPLTTTHVYTPVVTESTPSSTHDLETITTEETTGTEEPLTTTYSSTPVVTESPPSSPHDPKTLTTEETTFLGRDEHKKVGNNVSLGCETGKLLRGFRKDKGEDKYISICFPFSEDHFASSKALNYSFVSWQSIHCSNTNNRKLYAITNIYLYSEKKIWSKTYISCREIKTEYVKRDVYGRNIISSNYKTVECPINSALIEVRFPNRRVSHPSCASLKLQ